MLVWINGPFGGGKTAAGFELHRRLPGSVVCDPEFVGYGLHRMLPPGQRGDFQDLSAWRSSVHQMLDLTLRRHDGTVIVPMTLVNDGYFAEIVGRLRADGFDVRHFALLADRGTVLRRLRKRRLGGLIRDDFAIGRLDDCLKQLRQPQFAEHLRTDRMTVPEVAEAIASSAGLAIAGRSGPVRSRLEQTGTSLRHVRSWLPGG
jgi:AAA domain